MVDLLPILLNATKTLQRQMTQWFSAYPAGMPWTVVSDYCIGDDGKKNDVLSFVVIANHDKASNICEYLAAVAPRDIKSTSQVPIGLIQYLTCNYPVTFSVSFVIARSSALLRSYLRTEDMASFIPEASELIKALRGNSLVDLKYFDGVLKRFEAFGRDASRKQFNGKLARHVHLAAAFVATLFYLVHQSTQAGHLRWISDRDALVERYDTVVYDLAFLYFVMTRSAERSSAQQDERGVRMLDLPKVLFEIPEKAGKHRYDELIRLPDYLAGTLADLDMTTLATSRDKFTDVFHSVFVNSSNNWVVQLEAVDDRIVARSVQFRG